MVTFSFEGAIADIDELPNSDGIGTTKLLILQVGEHFERVELPDDLFHQVEAKLCAGRVVSVQGEIKSSADRPHNVAASLEFTDPGH